MRFRLSAFALLSILAPSAFSVVLVKEKFNHGFTNGNLNGQNGFTTSITGTNFRYDKNVGLGGSGGVFVNTKPQTGQGYAYDTLNYATATHPILLATLDVTSLGFANGATSGATSRFGLGLYNGAGDVIARLAYKFSDGTSQASIHTLVGGGTANAFVDPNMGTFEDLESLAILVDTQHSFALFAVNGAVVDAESFTSDASVLGSVALYSNATGKDVGAFDNLKVRALVAPVPEPTTLGALAVGALALLRRRRVTRRSL